METHETHHPSHPATETHQAHAPAHQALTKDIVVQFIKTKPIKIALCSIAGLIVLLLVFGAGIEVGFHKADHSFRWGENYHKNFGGPREGFMRGGPKGLGQEDFIDAHGTVGQVIKIEGQTLIIKGRDGVEKTVLLKGGDEIRKGRETVAPADLKVDDMVVVIGEPNDAGQIEAKFIRLMPTPPNQPAPGQLPPPSAQPAQGQPTPQP